MFEGLEENTVVFLFMDFCKSRSKPGFQNLDQRKIEKNYHQCCQDLDFSETGFVSKSGTQCDSSN